MRIEDDNNPLTLCDEIITVIFVDHTEVIDAPIGKKIYGVEVIYHDGEFDPPITLRSIKEKYPDVKMVIAEGPTEGKVYRYGNHLDNYWEQVGKTIGYA